jgi:hypothetical protein
VKYEKEVSSDDHRYSLSSLIFEYGFRPSTKDSKEDSRAINPGEKAL